MIPGEMFLAEEEIIINQGLESISLEVHNDGDRPIQVGSHFPFADTNSALSFDRESATGRRLDIPSGTAVRFEPGQTKVVSLVKFSAKPAMHISSHNHLESYH